MERIRVKLSPSKERGRKVLSQKTGMGRPIPVITGMGGIIRDLENQNADKIQQLSDNLSVQGNVLANELVKQDVNTKTELEYLRKQDSGIYNALNSHVLADNPHGITKETIGLNRVDNTTDAEKPISVATQIALNEKADKAELEEMGIVLTEAIKKQKEYEKKSNNVNYIGGVGGGELPLGGKKGQILAKRSNKGLDVEWVDKPTVPTVNDATLTIQKNGTDVATFTANSSENKTANITVPTDTSDLTNGAGYAQVIIRRYS
jgi:hypothetical protein